MRRVQREEIQVKHRFEATNHKIFRGGLGSSKKGKMMDLWCLSIINPSYHEQLLGLSRHSSCSAVLSFCLRLQRSSYVGSATNSPGTGESTKQGLARCNRSAREPNVDSSTGLVHLCKKCWKQRKDFIRIPAEGQQSRPSRSLVRDMKFNHLNIVEGRKVL